MSTEQFIRTQLLLGQEGLDKLAASRVAVFGIGGVGGYVVEALARAGVGAIDVVDDDAVSVSNLNRQIIATWDTVGMSKVDAAEQRIHAINPDCKVTKHQCFYLPATRDEFDFSAYDYVVDAVDTVTAKLDLIVAAKEAGVPIISSMGTGNKLDPTQLRIADVDDTSVCRLAKIIRKECRKRGIKDVTVLYSLEPSLEPDFEGVEIAPDPEHPRRSPVPGSTSFVPPAAGLAIASYVVRQLTGVEARHE